MTRIEEHLLRYRRGLILLTHAVVFVASLCLAFMLRFDLVVPELYRDVLLRALPTILLCKLVVFGALGQYSGWWRYASISDGFGILRATALSFFVVGAVVYLQGLREFPRSIFVLDALLTAVSLGVLRVAVRLVRERWFRSVPTTTVPQKRCLLVGTGSSAEGLLREVTRSPALGIQLVGLVSPDDRYIGARVGGLSILGSVESLPRLVAKYEVQQVIIALESNSAEVTRRVISLCSSADVAHRILPPTEDLVQGRVALQRLRDVSLQDLLGRPPVRLAADQIGSLISGMTVLVTGAGGSIGSELCLQVARFGAARLVMVEQAENPLFHLERLLIAEFPELRLEPIIADVGDRERILAVMQEFEPRLVLHAAAHKHVPLMEVNPSEAIKNNVIGTANVIAASQQAGVRTCILISTDKAVNPTSVMGATKRMAEMLVQSQNALSSTIVAAVRFGNVLGSNGSVIPIFQQQIAKGGPVTVTHPEMRRYFMTIPEATQLVLQAGAFARGGEVFVLDMGDPVYIVDVARDLIRLSGLRPDDDIQIVFSGMRPGEKLFEELSTAQEVTDRTSHERVFRCQIEPPDPVRVLRAARRLEELAHTRATATQVRRALFEMLHALETGQALPGDPEVVDARVIPIAGGTRAPFPPV